MGRGNPRVRAWGLSRTFGWAAIVPTAATNVSAAAFSMAVHASGVCKAAKMTPLMSIEEGIEAMRKAQAASPAYRPPTG